MLVKFNIFCLDDKGEWTCTLLFSRQIAFMFISFKEIRRDITSVVACGGTSKHTAELYRLFLMFQNVVFEQTIDCVF